MVGPWLEVTLSSDPVPLGLDAPSGPSAAATLPRVSVVIPAYNEAALLPACLRSLAGQDYPERFEVIVADNDSSDDTAAIARAMGATVVHEPHPGVCWARQRGTAAARGEIVVSTDADTTFEPGWLSRIDAAFHADPRRVAVTGPCRFAHAPWWGRAYAFLLFGLVHLIYRLTGRVLYVTATNIAFRRESWPGYDTRATQGGDELDLLRRLRARGPVAFDRRNPTSTSSRRLRRGLFYNLVVTCGFYYLTGYLVNRICRRTVIGTAPHITEDSGARSHRQRLAHLAWVTACMSAVLLATWLVGHLEDVWLG